MINGKFYVIDSHCHIYPEKIAQKAVAGTDAFYELTSEFNGTVTSLKEQGEISGIDKFVVQSVATTPKQVKSINEFIAGETAKHAELFGLGTLHPESGDIAGDIEHLCEIGLHGVKLHPDIQRFKIDDYRCLKIYELCEQKNLPILMHTGDNRYDFSNPNRIKPILEIYKNLTVIGAHLGGYSIWEQAANELCQYDNFYVDTSSSFPFITAELAKKVILTYTPKKVLFGTDYPLKGAKTELEFLLNLGLSDDDLRLILSENAKKVFKI